MDAACAGAARRLDDCIGTKHAGDAESINCADGVKTLAAKLYAVLCRFPGEWVSIKYSVCRRIAAQQVMCLELGNEHSNIFYGEAGLSGNFAQMRRP